MPPKAIDFILTLFVFWGNLQGHRDGYIRVSSFDHDPESQTEQVEVSKVFTDKASGKDTERPALEELLSFVREGDTVAVHSMDRLARNLDDLRRLVQQLTERGVACWRIDYVISAGWLNSHPILWKRA
jgi:DNA invertase Pin-like site-specific DNA recombinase